MKLMSALRNIFKSRKRKSQEKLEAQEAIDKLRETETLLIRKQEHFEQKIEVEIATAKKHGTKNKRAALMALKRKKRYEVELSRIDGTLHKIEAQRTALEDAGTNMEVLKTMELAGKALKLANNNMNLDKVNDLMDDITEGLEDANEFNEAISQPIGMVTDEDDLMAELEQLQQNALRETVGELPAVPAKDLPAGPMTRSKTKRQDSELAALDQWLANA